MKTIALLLCAALITPGCASTRPLMQVADLQTTPSPAAFEALAEYVQKLPAGARIAATLSDGRRLRGTLLKTTSQAIVLQLRARIPEAPVEIPLGQLRMVELETKSGGGVGRAVAVGAAVGAGAALGFLLLIAALMSD